MLTVQRKQTLHHRLTGQRVLDLGVDEVDLIQLAGLEIVDGVHRDVAGALQRGGRGTIVELFHQARVLVEQSAVAGLTNDVEAGIGVAAALLFQELEQVLVVGTRHALVGRQHDIGTDGVFLFPLMEERVDRLVRQMRHDAGDGVPHPGEIRQNVLVVLACLAELGGGDQVHGIRDLHGILNALDPLLEQLTGRHGSPLPHRSSTRSGWRPPAPA